MKHAGPSGFTSVKTSTETVGGSGCGGFGGFGGFGGTGGCGPPPPPPPRGPPPPPPRLCSPRRRCPRYRLRLRLRLREDRLEVDRHRQCRHLPRRRVDAVDREVAGIRRVRWLRTIR